MPQQSCYCEEGRLHHLHTPDQWHFHAYRANSYRSCPREPVLAPVEQKGATDAE